MNKTFFSINDNKQLQILQNNKMVDKESRGGSQRVCQHVFTCFTMILENQFEK